MAFDVPAPALDAGGSSFEWRGHAVRLAVPGAHNARNAAAALEAAVLAGADPAAAAAALADFAGAGRRFQALGTTSSGARVIDDYAHHPTEVAATIDAARTLGPRRVVAVFQPHLYSRTQRLAHEFGAALARADVAAVLDVYPARERAEDFPGVTGLLVAEAAADAAGGRQVLWLPTFDAAEPVLRGLLRDGDLCLVLGAGDVDALGRRLVADGVTSGDARAPHDAPRRRRPALRAAPAQRIGDRRTDGQPRRRRHVHRHAAPAGHGRGAGLRPAC